MISYKRQCPSLAASQSNSEQDGELANMKNASKKVKIDSAVKNNSSGLESIKEVPNIKLTVAQMNSDPLALIRELERAYAEFGAVKLTVSDAWNCPFTFGYADRPITVRVQTVQELQQGKVPLFYAFLKHFIAPFD